MERRLRIAGLALAGLSACKNGGSADTSTGAEESSGTEESGGSMCAENGMQDGDETDVDCGGGACPVCTFGQGCLLASDCETMACVDGVCGDGTCSDGSKNQNETGPDCGGPCPPCGTGENCEGDDDCLSQKCEGGMCAAPTCDDDLHNGDEGDVDCGGAHCPGCADGQSCQQNGDCQSGYCDVDTCGPKSCQEDSECADLDGPCADGVCDMGSFTCTAMPINEGMPCDDEDACTLTTSCVDGTCGAGTPVDCSNLDDQCLVGTCDPADGTCFADPANEDMACDDGDPCTADDVCQAGTCLDPSGLDIHLDEDFSDNGLGWSLGTKWEIGPATESPQGGGGTGKDPASDHSPTGDDGIAGVLIGGLTSGSQSFTYLQSPPIDLGNAAGDVTLTLWRWLNSDADPKMNSVIEVYDGNSWVTVWENGNMVIADAMWTEQTFDVTDHKAASFRVRVGYKATGSTADVGGWNVDDIVLAPPGCVP